jgi:hypothetical protein
MNNLWHILNYEIQMYIGARMLQGYSITKPSKDKNVYLIQMSALTEVKALHIRILVDIFLPRKNQSDLNIDDLLPDWRDKHVAVLNMLNSAYHEKLAIGESPRWYLNKFLAHPDKQRGPSFEWGPVVKRMDSVLKAVFRTLPNDENILPALVVFHEYI